jgi:two-component system, OmpR family, sensor kinase
VTIKNIRTSHLVHDLKNPVNIIETSTRSMLDNPERYGTLTDKQEKVLGRILRNAIKIKGLVHSMLEVDQAGMGIVNVSECALSGVLKEALVEVLEVVDPAVSDALNEAADMETFRRILGEHNIFLEAEDAQLDQVIETDRTKLCLILTNLLTNAFKYRSKRVFLKCAAQNDTVNVSVRDDGPGIPEAFHQQIFDQYFQCTKVEDFPVRGHGLGLAGALALTEAMGGTLSLCKCPEGAEFVVQLRLPRQE